MNKQQKFIGITLGVIMAIGLILWGVNGWVESKIRSVLDLETSKGEMDYGSVSVNIFTNRAVVKEIQWEQKGMSATVDQLRVRNLSLLRYLTKGDIYVGAVELERPKVVMRSRPDSSALDTSSSALQMSHSIGIRKVNMVDGEFQYFQKDRSLLPLLFIFPELEIEGISINQETLREDIPFRYGQYYLLGDSFFYQINDKYDLIMKGLKVEDNHVVLDTFRLRPRYDKYEFQRHIPYEKTRADLVIPRLEIEEFQWDKTRDSLTFLASVLRVDSADLKLYRDKRLADNPEVKPMYSKLIRELPFRIGVDSVLVHGGQITYEILFNEKRNPATVYLEKVNGRIAHVSNIGMNTPEFPQTEVTANALLMKESKVHLDWHFSINEPSDAFHVSGSLSRITGQGMNYFLKPAMNVSVKGAIDEIAFNYAGDDMRVKGDMRMRYDEFKVELLKKDGTKKVVLSAMANLLVKNKMSGPVEKKDIKVERDQTKSFWAYLWKMVQKGSLEFLL